MSDKQDLPAETAEGTPEAGDKQEQKTPVKGNAESTEAEEFDKERAMSTIRKQREEAEQLREQLKKAKAAQKKLDEWEAEENKRKEAELSEAEKLKKKLAEYEVRIAEQERRELLRKVADETQLPAWLADRLQGKDEDELRADAEKLLEHIKATAKPSQPKIASTTPANNTPPETDGEKSRRLLTPKAKNVFSTEGAKELGGGVTYND